MDKRVKNLEWHASRWAVCSLCAWDHSHTYLGEWHSRFALLDHYFHTGHNAKDKLRRSVSRGRDQVKPCQSASLSRRPNLSINQMTGIKLSPAEIIHGCCKEVELDCHCKGQKNKRQNVIFFKLDV